VVYDCVKVGSERSHGSGNREADSGDMHVLLSRISSDPNDVGEAGGLRGVMTQVTQKHRDL
jgi:hypothetical protein